MDAFNNASNCLRNQYSTYSIKEIFIDGNFTLGENIADDGALRIAEMAFEYLLSNASWTDQDSLPSLEHFTQQKLFYLGLAMLWCEVKDDFNEKDTHAPNRFRVNGPLSNSDKFAQIWGCKLGSAMNPKDKCHMWG